MCCSTTPKTKAANPAVNDPAKIAKQTPGGGGGGGGAGGGVGGGPAVLKFGTEQEHVPDLTFIIAPRTATDDYLAGATTYHSNCGLSPQQIKSIDHLVDLLSASATPLKRIRIVGHASGEDLIIPLFGQPTEQKERHSYKKNLSDFATSDEAGLLGLFDMAPAQHHIPWVMTEIIDMTRTANDTLLEPFGMKKTGTPDVEDLKHFILYSCDYALVNLGYYMHKSKAALTADEKTGMLKAYKQLIAIRKKKIEGTSFGTHTVTGGELDALSNYLMQRSANDLTLTDSEKRMYDDVAGALNPFLLAGRAADAMASGFRDKLEKVRKRLNSGSVIDIRGCRAGNDRDYLRAIQDFLGDAASKPAVTAPTWYQAFTATNSYSHPADITAIHTLLTAGTGAAGIRKGFDTWATMAHVDPEHKQVWLDALDNGAVKFVLLEWRKKLPQLPVATPGLTTFLAMSLVDFITKTKDFFNVPAASMPSAAALTSINTYVTSKLGGYSANLLAAVDSATAQSKLDAIAAALKPINIELGNPVNPEPAAPVKYLDVKDYQDKLVTAINESKLKDLKPFLNAVKTRINDTAEPGLHYYMLFSGMPVYAFADKEIVNDHQVNVKNNRLVVLDAFADQAYRQWPQLSWAEPLPSGNKFGSMHPGDFDARRAMMMVQNATGGLSPAAVCPHPDYFTHMNSV